ncbi:MAG: hypothetical protein PHY71_06185 [Bacteroidaceae bacterium]|nr:hypothetical protein [Bacteroidaceae bacterium]
MNPIIANYQQAQQKYQAISQKYRKRFRRAGTLKLVLVTHLATLGYVLREDSTSTLLLLAGGCLLGLLLLNMLQTHFQQIHHYNKTRALINEQELQSIANNDSSFDGGEEYIDSNHLYSYDLDLFGAHSLFKHINRTVTLFGKERLAKWFNQHLLNKAAIEKQQEAIQELSSLTEFRHHFRALGINKEKNTISKKELTRWIQLDTIFSPSLQFLPLIALLTNGTLLLLASLGFISYTLQGSVFVLFIILHFLFVKRINKVQSDYDKRFKQFATYAQLIGCIEKESFKSALLCDFQATLKKDEITASKAIAQLGKLTNALDQRNNILVALFLNGLFLWELWQCMRIENWKKEYAPYLGKWMQTLGEMEAVCSLATFAANYPANTYATIRETPFQFVGEELTHPLMPATQAVANPSLLTPSTHFIIITGANMAGKSTYLRVVGVNYLLACIGAPVCGKAVEIYPTQLVTSLRTSDSLSENESYFFAELKRLKRIIDLLNDKQDLFIILDEILKGTNSIDKQKGSLALIEQFMQLDTHGIIATHDLVLGQLKERFPTAIENYCFEADIVKDQLSFTYQIRKGLAQNMNACFLMKKMGIYTLD